MEQVKYKGNHTGTTQSRHFKPGEVKVVPLDKVEKLIETGQFELVEEVKKPWQDISE